MNEHLDKKSLSELMKALGLKNRGAIWAYIKTEDRTDEQVRSFILKVKAEQDEQDNRPAIALNNPIVYRIFGQPIIERLALDDMAAIARLPYVKQAAQMPDSHRVKEGHVPVGGVVVTHDCVLPGVVGNDIACSVGGLYTNEPVNQEWFQDNTKSLRHILETYTYFGQEYNPFDAHYDTLFGGLFDSAHNIMDMLFHDESKKLLNSLLGTMRNHFATSGEGNHFIELGMSDLRPVNTGTRGLVILARERMTYNFAILTHFGSRGLGSHIANFYLNKANELHPVPKGMQDNAPLFFGTDQWAEDYWMLMSLCGDFASCGHSWIQQQVLQHIARRCDIDFEGLTKTVMTTHNFAWVEDEGFVHRKGATPAHAGQYANIPATMGDQSRIVVGMGNPDYLKSASHGAGRKMSRSQALKQGWEDVGTYVAREFGVTLIGGGSDEDPRSYKKIDEVMKYQTDSVKEIGRFTPFVCRMAEPQKTWGKNKKK